MPLSEIKVWISNHNYGMSLIIHALLLQRLDNKPLLKFEHVF